VKTLSWVALVVVVSLIGCQERVVRRSQYSPTTPFGAATPPVTQKQSKQTAAKPRQQLSTDWHGTPKMTNGRSIGQPVVPSGHRDHD